MSVTPDEAARRIAGFAASLGSEAAAAAFATAWIKEAKTVANTGPSPQARMAASGIQVSGAHVVGPANALVSRSSSPGSVPLGDILFGSEFGSSIYPQFGGRTTTGNWLFKSADSPNVMAAFETEYVDKAIAVVTSG